MNKLATPFKLLFFVQPRSIISRWHVWQITDKRKPSTLIGKENRVAESCQMGFDTKRLNIYQKAKIWPSKVYLNGSDKHVEWTTTVLLYQASVVCSPHPQLLHLSPTCIILLWWATQRRWRHSSFLIMMDYLNLDLPLTHKCDADCCAIFDAKALRTKVVGKPMNPCPTTPTHTFVAIAPCTTPIWTYK